MTSILRGLEGHGSCLPHIGICFGRHLILIPRSLLLMSILQVPLKHHGSKHRVDIMPY